jgi:hypothetical protein
MINEANEIIKRNGFKVRKKWKTKKIKEKEIRYLIKVKYPNEKEVNLMWKPKRKK